MNISKINTFTLNQNMDYKKRINTPIIRVTSKPTPVALESQLSFNSLFGFLKPSPIIKTNKIVKIIKDKDLKKLTAFKQLEDFLNENNLSIIIDSSRKKYNAKPSHFVEIENLGNRDQKSCGWGNTPEGVVGNLILSLADWKERNVALTNFWSGKQYEIPYFHKNDLKKIESFLRVQFEQFKNK